MGVLFAFLPLIVFLIVRARINQVQAQTPPRQEQAPQTPPQTREDVPIRRDVRPCVSTEGTASDEGECVEENPQHCAVEHSEEAAYALDSVAALPRGELARAVVVSEILGKPVSLRGDRF